MDGSTVWILISVVGTGGGMLVGWIGRKTWAVQQIESAEAKLQQAIQETKNKQKELIIEAKDKSLGILENAKKEGEEIQKDVKHRQERLEKRESMFDQKLLSIEDRGQKLEEKKVQLETAKNEINKIREDQIQKLEKIAGLNKEEAKKVLLDNTENENAKQKTCLAGLSKELPAPIQLKPLPL